MTTIDQNTAIQSFVQEALGCRCPEQVFEQIDYDAQWMRSDSRFHVQHLVIGNRLLIYLLETEAAADPITMLAPLAARGRAERDLNGYNRLRIVVSADRPEQLRPQADRLFSNLRCVDEKMHLHILAKDRCLKRPAKA